MQLTGQRIMFDLRMAIYRHLQSLDLQYYDRNPVGRLMTRVTSDVDALNDLFTSGVVTIFGDVFTLVGIMAIMLGMNWRLALVAFSVLPLIALVTQWFRRHVRESYRVVRGLIARINAFLQENITGMSTVQLFRREALNYARFDEIDAEHRDANVESIFYYSVFYPAVEVVAAWPRADHLVWRRRSARHADPRALVAFVQVSQRFFSHQRHVGEVQRAAGSDGVIGTHFRASREPVVIDRPAAPVVRPPTPGHIVFEHVWFAYKGSDFVLRT
jgi:ATP-binding cassette subfamily B protein